MSTVRVRSKHQITLPVSIVNQAGIHQDDLLGADTLTCCVLVACPTWPAGSRRYAPHGIHCRGEIYLARILVRAWHASPLP